MTVRAISFKFPAISDGVLRPALKVMLGLMVAGLVAAGFIAGPFAAGLALIATGISFWAVGHYDVIWHRTLDTGLPPRRAHRTGMAAVAIGQFLGASSITSGLVRKYAMPELSPITIAQVSAGAALSFSGAWAILAMVAIMVGSDHLPFDAPAPFLILLLTIGIALMLVRLGRQKLIRTGDIAAVFICTIVDLSGAGLALYVLLPATVEISFVQFLSIFVLAMGAGILSHLPGGLGAFDLVILFPIPHDNHAAMLLTLVVFRTVYYGLPLVLALLWLQSRRAKPYPAQPLTDPPPLTPADWGVAAQSGRILSTRTGAFHVCETPCGLIGMGDPVGARPWMLAQLAAETASLPAFYKCSARVATALRQRGWRVVRIAQNAIVTPADWSLAGRGKQTLRRKIRIAKAAGVRITHARGPLPMAEMSRIAAHWAATNKGEMGFSMGRFDPAYVRGQIVFLIHHDDRLRGFITLHRGSTDWALDLIRRDGSLPQGAIHLAVNVAIETAQGCGVQKLSLAAVPDTDHRVMALHGGRAGLTQFKRTFDPQWHPLYFAAPHPFAVIVTACGILWKIHRPLARRWDRIIAALRHWRLSSPPLHGISRALKRPARPAPKGSANARRSLNLT